jgi:hypothetical protein
MALVGSITAGHPDEGDLSRPLQQPKPVTTSGLGRKIKGASAQFGKKNPGSPGKLGGSGLSEGLARLRGKGALA